MKTSREQLEELLGKKVSLAPTPIADACDELNIPEALINRMLGLDALEATMVRLTMALIIAKELNHQGLVKRLSEEIGALVAEQLAKGNYDAPRAISEGLMRLQEGKEFKKTKQRRLSIRDQMLVLMAYHLLQKIGCKNPPQADVLAALEIMGAPMRKDRVSKIFDALGLKNVARDARLAVNRPHNKLPMKSD